MGIIISTAAFLWLAYSSTATVSAAKPAVDAPHVPVTSQSSATPLLNSEGAAAPATATGPSPQSAAPSRLHALVPFPPHDQPP